jgi:ABC-type amino acid transport substrate-binding protein
MKAGKFRGWITGLGVALLLLAGVALGRLAWGGADDGTLERVQASGELRVGLDASFPPFESLDAAGDVVGIDADLARSLAGQWGAQPVFVNIGFDGLYDALLAGRVDVVISGLPYDPRRTQDVLYSQPYFNAGQVLVVRAADTAIAQDSAHIPGDNPQAPMLELSGRTIAVEWGSLADMEARRLRQTVEGMQTLPQPTARDALDALVAGQADAAIADAVSVYQFMGEHAGQVRLVVTLTQEPYVIATRPRSRRLAEAVDAALTQLRETGTLDALPAKWF